MRSPRSTPGTWATNPRPRRRSGRATRRSVPRSKRVSSLLRVVPPPDTFDPRYTIDVRERGRSEAGVIPARPRHCDGHGLRIDEATSSLSRHWATRKASEGPKPGDLSVRATYVPSGEGWWRVERRLRRRTSPIFGPEDGRFSFSGHAFA